MAIEAGKAFGHDGGSCDQCGHPSAPHIITAFDVTDFSKGGEMRCPVEGCACYWTLSFNVKPPETPAGQ